MTVSKSIGIFRAEWTFMSKLYKCLTLLQGLAQLTALAATRPSKELLLLRCMQGLAEPYGL